MLESALSVREVAASYGELARVKPLTQQRSKQMAGNANRELYRLLKDGVKVKVADDTGAPNTPYAGLEHIAKRSIALADWGVLKQYPVPTSPVELQARFRHFMGKVVALQT